MLCSPETGFGKDSGEVDLNYIRASCHSQLVHDVQPLCVEHGIRLTSLGSTELDLRYGQAPKHNSDASDTMNPRISISLVSNLAATQKKRNDVAHL